MQCKQTWIFLEFFFVETNFFLARILFVFFPKLYGVNCALLCHPPLLIVNAKDKKSDVFSYFEKVKGEFICKVEENVGVCGAKLATKPFAFKRHLENIIMTFSNVSKKQMKLRPVKRQHVIL